MDVGRCDRLRTQRGVFLSIGKRPKAYAVGEVGLVNYFRPTPSPYTVKLSNRDILKVELLEVDHGSLKVLVTH